MYITTLINIIKYIIVLLPQLWMKEWIKFARCCYYWRLLLILSWWEW